MRAWKQPLHHGSHGLSAKYESFFAASAVEHAVGKDVTTLKVGSQLDLVDRKERNVEVPRHCLNGRHPKAGIGRLDFLLAGDERDRLGAHPIDHLVVNLARQKPQWQPNDTGRMAEHSLNGQMRFPGVGWSKHRCDAGTAGAGVATCWRREGDRHHYPMKAVRLAPMVELGVRQA